MLDRIPITTDNQGPQDTFVAGDQLLIARPGPPYAGVGHSSRLRFTLLDPAILTRVALTADGDGVAQFWSCSHPVEDSRRSRRR